MKKSTLGLLTSIFIFLIAYTITVATAQDTVHPLLTLSSDQLTFHAKENGAPSSIDLTLVGLAPEDGVAVKIVNTKLYDNSSGESITITEITQTEFDLTKNDLNVVTVTLDPSGVKAGNYEGSLIITATNKTTTAEILTTKIKVTAEIESAAFWYESDKQIMFIVGAIAPIFIGLLIPDKDVPKYKSKRFWLVVLGAISVSFWLVSIVTLSFKEPGTIINTVLVTPFLTYVISFVKDKRTERLEREKASREIRTKGIENDINLIRAIMGETATHCASFRPHLYTTITKSATSNNPKPKQTTDFDEYFEILFNKSGKLSREVWEKSCKQGIVADLPLLELEKYYDFLDIYNSYYSRAISLTKDNKPSEVALTDFDFEKFNKFREDYAELETVVFVYLSYILGHLSKTYLSPLKVEYRRVTRTLLLRLIEYGILKPDEYNEQIQCYIKYHSTNSDYINYLETRKQELGKQKFTDPETNKETFRFIIKKWHFDADDIEEIYGKIYSRTNIPRVYRKVADDFKNKYFVLKETIAKLPPIKEEPEEPEKKRIEMSGHLAILKEQQAVEIFKAKKEAAADEVQTSAKAAAKSATDIIGNSVKDAKDAAKRAEALANSKDKTK